jgi:hypothetical protein
VFVAKHPRCFLVTWTFRENITDKKEAMQRWKPVRDYLVRQGVDFVGVWQRQKRGAWHFHALVNLRLNVVTLRAFCVERGWGSQLNIELIGRGSDRFSDAATAVRYLCRYLTRDYGEVGRSRLTSGLDSNSVGNTRFSWVGGRAHVWRVGCAAMAKKAKGYWRPLWGERGDILLAGAAALKLSGFDLMRLHLDWLIGWRPPREVLAV